MKRLLPLAVTLAGLTPCAQGAEIIDLQHPDRVPNQYLVKLKPQQNFRSNDGYVLEQAIRLEQRYGVKIFSQYSNVLAGLAVKAQDAQITAMMDDPIVERIEADKLVRASAVQKNATWGLDRVDSRTGIDGKYTYTSTGKGVHAYIVDTGLRASHSEFSGRVGPGFSSVEDGKGTSDCAGHGTHVAGTVGGKLYGVAKEVTIHPVRVLDCEGSGTLTGVIAGLDWLTGNALLPAVANMSLGGGQSDTLDEAVQKSISEGIHFVVAAGNENSDACETSPANVPEAITVGSTMKNDLRSSFSNYGTCVDIFAPGSSITSAGINADASTDILSGTSMASPHVAGAVALLLQSEPSLTPAQLAIRLNQNATLDKVKDPGEGSPNTLLFTGAPLAN